VVHELLAGAFPVVPWLLLLMRRLQLQRSQCAGALGPAHLAQEALAGALPVVTWLLLMRRA
jgi:hypothetical protein